MTMTTFLRAACVAALLPLPALAQQAGTAPARADSSYRAPASVRGAGPNGATLRCRDGSHPAPLAPETACDGKGGVAIRYPRIATPAPPQGAATPTARTAPTALQAEPEAPAPTPSRANVRIDAARPPADATLHCNDGTFIRADTSVARCASHGGLRARITRRAPR